MAQRRSKKKRPLREEYMLREQLKIEDEAFDDRTVMRLGDLFTHGIISKIHFLTARGKEADVYLADPGDKVEEELVAVKVFRIETSDFDNRMVYIIGDPRFSKIKHNIYSVVNEWCKKEYGNLKIAQQAGVNAPKPYMFSGNVLAMEFIGSNGVPASMLKDVRLDNPGEILASILSSIKKLYKAGLVHADMSEYNVLVKDGKPFLIDFGQAVVLRHPNAMQFLERDVHNILNYFYKEYGISYDYEKAINEIVQSQEQGA